MAVEIQAVCAPLKRPAPVEALLGSAGQYDEAAIQPLESYVAQQVATGTYDALANKALCKLYQFNPARCNGDVLARVLAKAMMARPAPDITSLLYVVPEALVAASPLCDRLAKCDALLESSKFAEFWAMARDADGGKAVVDLAPGFVPAVRRYLVDLLAQTFERVPLELLAEVLGCDAGAAAALAKAPPAGGLLVPSTDPKHAVFAPNAHNTKRQETFVKAVQLDSLLSLYNADENIFASANQ
jgi:translation initiation factor 3 subunit K